MSTNTNQEKVSEAIEILNKIKEDDSVPRKVRETITETIEVLNDEEMELHLRAINALDKLELITANADNPFHARTMLWQVITRLELPRD